MSPKMLFILPTLGLLQVIGVHASLEDVILPRAPVPGIIQDAAEVFVHGSSGLVPRAAPLACTFVLEAVSFCASVSPGFVTLNPTKQAPCLCYSSTAWVPTIFDGAVQTCASYARTADPADYSAFSVLQGFCSSVGNVKPASTVATTTKPVAPTSVSAAQTTTQAAKSTTPPVTTPPQTTVIPTPTSASVNIATNPGCSALSADLESCLLATQGFTDLPQKSQAACLCYSSSIWKPDSFDSPVSSCASFVQTADPKDYSVVTPLLGFCTRNGDVLAVASPTPGTGNPATGNTLPAVKTTPTSSSAATAQSTSTGAAGGGGGGAVTVTAASTTPSSPIPSASKAAAVPARVGFENWFLRLVSFALSSFLFF